MFDELQLGLYEGKKNEQERIVKAIRQMQKKHNSNFISGNDLIDIIFEKNKETVKFEYEGWD